MSTEHQSELLLTLIQMMIKMAFLKFNSLIRRSMALFVQEREKKKKLTLVHLSLLSFAL